MARLWAGRQKCRFFRVRSLLQGRLPVGTQEVWGLAEPFTLSCWWQGCRSPYGGQLEAGTLCKLVWNQGVSTPGEQSCQQDIGEHSRPGCLEKDVLQLPVLAHAQQHRQ